MLWIVVGIYAETWDHTTFIANIVILPLAFVGGVFYSIDAALTLGGALARESRLLSRQRRALCFLGEADVSVWLSPRSDGGAGHSRIRMGAVPVHHGQALEGLERRAPAAAAAPPRGGRERVAREKRAAFLHEDYWGRPLPGFGRSRRAAILGLAPAAHGGNRTGRIFTGDRSGDWLFAAPTEPASRISRHRARAR